MEKIKDRAWDKLQTTLQYFDLPPSIENTLRWVEQHPRTVLAGTLAVLMAVALTQVPEPKPEPEAYNDEVPLFV